MSPSLPANPNITQLKKQAKDLQRSVRSGDPNAIDRIHANHPAPPASFGDFALRDAQLVIAREYGFDGWHALNAEVGNRMVDERDLHRWFGVQLNNGIWDVIDTSGVAPDSSIEDRERVLYSAYASAYHWRNAGTVAHAARGEHLISRTAVLVGRNDLALHHARRCVELVQGNPDEMEDWDLGFALEALARAEAAVGDVDAARETLERAVAATAAVADEEDRKIIQGELAREPWFGLQ